MQFLLGLMIKLTPFLLRPARLLTKPNIKHPIILPLGQKLEMKPPLGPAVSSPLLICTDTFRQSCKLYGKNVLSGTYSEHGETYPQFLESSAE